MKKHRRRYRKRKRVHYKNDDENENEGEGEEEEEEGVTQPKLKKRKFQNSDQRGRGERRMIKVLDISKLILRRLQEGYQVKDIFKRDPYLKIFYTAKTRNYPFVEETIELYSILKAVEYLLCYGNVYIQNKQTFSSGGGVGEGEIRNWSSKVCKIRTRNSKSMNNNNDTTTNNNNNNNNNRKSYIIFKYIDCNIVNITSFYNLLKEQCKGILQSSPGKKISKKSQTIIKFILEEHKQVIQKLDKDVYVCLTHRTDNRKSIKKLSVYTHICKSNFCIDRIVGKDGQFCPISHRILRNRILQPYQQNSGMSFEKRKGSVGKRMNIKKIYANIFHYEYNGLKLENINVEKNILEIQNLYNDYLLVQNLHTFVWCQYNKYQSMIYDTKHGQDGILYCNKIITKENGRLIGKRGNHNNNQHLFDENDGSGKTRGGGGGGRRGRKKIKDTIPIRQKKLKRKHRVKNTQHYNKRTSDQLRGNYNIRDRNLKSKFTKFPKFVKKINHVSESVTIFPYTHLLEVKNLIDETNKNAYPKMFYPLSQSSHYVDPHPLTWMIISEGINDIQFRMDNPWLFYFCFLNLPQLQGVIELDTGNELILRDVDHPFLKKSSDDFLRHLHRKIRFIKRICPGLFRIIMMKDEIKKECNDKISSLKTYFKLMHNKKCIPSLNHIQELLTYDYKNLNLHITISDEFVLEIAEIMFWCEKMCKIHPNFKRYGAGELTEEILFVGTIYLMQTGLQYTIPNTCHTIEILPQHPKLSQQNYLIPQNKSATILTNRSDLSSGIKFIKTLLLTLCKIMPPQHVSFLYWKSQHEELNYDF